MRISQGELSSDIEAKIGRANDLIGVKCFASSAKVARGVGGCDFHTE
jgi:hypothetical protein